MKKKLIIAAAVFCTLIVVLLIAARLTGILQYYSIPTPSNEPNIKQGDKVFTTNQKDPLPGNFIVYTSNYADSLNISYMPGFKNGTIYIHRLCGIPGNIIEMKNGVLYVDDKNFDKNINLNNQYKINAAGFYSIEQEDMNNMEALGGTMMISNDTGIITFDNALLKKYQHTFNLVPFIITNRSADCFAWYDKGPDWTADNFGPIKIPADCYFVLGDNRHNALDSRYTGFVKKENIKGVAINK